jgi:hypothetical protein
MLRQVVLDRKPNGALITIPTEINETNVDQQIKRFVEIADYNRFDGQLHISLFRHFHGGEWTLRILQAILQELRTSTIVLKIASSRNELMPFFEYQFERHKKLSDSGFDYPGDHTRLPI